MCVYVLNNPFDLFCIFVETQEDKEAWFFKFKQKTTSLRVMILCLGPGRQLRVKYLLAFVTEALGVITDNEKYRVVKSETPAL